MLLHFFIMNSVQLNYKFSVPLILKALLLLSNFNLGTPHNNQSSIGIPTMKLVVQDDSFHGNQLVADIYICFSSINNVQSSKSIHILLYNILTNFLTWLALSIQKNTSFKGSCLIFVASVSLMFKCCINLKSTVYRGSDHFQSKW